MREGGGICGRGVVFVGVGGFILVCICGKEVGFSQELLQQATKQNRRLIGRTERRIILFFFCASDQFTIFRYTCNQMHLYNPFSSPFVLPFARNVGFRPFLGDFIMDSAPSTPVQSGKQLNTKILPDNLLFSSSSYCLGPQKLHVFH